MAKLVVYTTVYPGVEPYLADWFASVSRQTDQGFRLWVALDTLGVEAAKMAMGGEPDAVWVLSRDGDTPASLRQRALARIVDRCDAVVLVDSDDVMHATRVASARALLGAHDLAGCALRLVDEQGSSMDMKFTIPPGLAPDAVLPRTNAFGLSNTAIRADMLRRCLPIPDAAALVDWFLCTRAWLFGARLWFDQRVEMDYRQHGANMVRVRAPFSAEQVSEDTERVRRHYRLVLASGLEAADTCRLADLETAAADVESFHQRVVLRPPLLARYVEALNELGTTSLWWAWVAHPSLRNLWMREEGVA
jgi:hypothetical protein